MSGEVYTPGEIIKKYPALKSYGWDEKFIGSLVTHNLLDGKVSKNKNPNLVVLDSLHKLISFQNEIVNSKKIKL